MTIEKKAEGWIGDLVGALCDPIIVYPSPWKEDLPDWVKPQITLERLIMNMKAMHEGVCRWVIRKPWRTFSHERWKNRCPNSG